MEEVIISISYSDCVEEINLIFQEQKKTGVLKTQIESYKGLINELNEKLSAEIQKADKADFDLQKTMEKLDVLSKDRDRLAAELEILKETNEDREFSQLLQTPNNSTGHFIASERQS